MIAQNYVCFVFVCRLALNRDSKEMSSNNKEKQKKKNDLMKQLDQIQYQMSGERKKKDDCG